jgi:hypothetical protein
VVLVTSGVDELHTVAGRCAAGDRITDHAGSSAGDRGDMAGTNAHYARPATCRVMTLGGSHTLIRAMAITRPAGSVSSQ